MTSLWPFNAGYWLTGRHSQNKLWKLRFSGVYSDIEIASEIPNSVLKYCLPSGIVFSGSLFYHALAYSFIHYFIYLYKYAQKHLFYMLMSPLLDRFWAFVTAKK